MLEIKTETLEHTMVVYLPEKLTLVETNEFKRQMNAWLLSPVDSFVMDFRNTIVIEFAFYHVFLQFRSILKSNSKTVFSINLSRRLLSQIKTDGLDTALCPVKDLAEAQKTLINRQTSENQIDLEFIKPFLAGAKAAFETQCNTPIHPLKPFIKTAPMENVAIAAVLSLTSTNLQGTIVLSFPEDVFLKVYENMFEEKQTSITKESEDAAAELLNIIYGAAKVDLNQKGYSFPKSLPTVLRGQQIIIRQTGNGKTVVIPFDGAGGNFYLEVECERT